MLAFYLALIDDPSDKEKFTDIYNRYKDKMFYKAKSIVHRDELAEDVVQESLLKIAKNIANVGSSESGSTAAFVIIITRNTAYDMLKTERRQQGEELDEQIVDISKDTLRDALSDVGYNTILNEINSLEPIYKDVLTLRLVYDYSVSEISKMLKTSENTIKSRISRGKNILRERLENL